MIGVGMGLTLSATFARSVMPLPRPSSSSLAESRALLRLAGPIILSQVAQVLMGLLDTVMSGQAGAREQAVVGLGVALWVPVFMCLMSVVQALSPVVVHHYGAHCYGVPVDVATAAEIGGHRREGQGVRAAAACQAHQRNQHRVAHGRQGGQPPPVRAIGPGAGPGGHP